MGSKKRAKSMLPEIKKLIIEEALDKPEVGREALADELIEKIKQRYPKEVPPKFETVIKKISEARNHETSPLDQPWSVGTLKDNEYFIEPIAVSKIFQLKMKGLERLSIRTALWISRLSALPLSIDMLYMYAFLYAKDERLSEISGSKYVFDSKDIDVSLLKLLRNPDKSMKDLGSWEGAEKLIKRRRK